MTGTLLDYPTTDAREVLDKIKPVPLCPQCCRPDVKPFKKDDQYICEPCICVFTWRPK